MKAEYDKDRNIRFNRGDMIRANDLIIVSLHGMQAGSTLVFDDVSSEQGMTVIGTTSQEDDELNAGLKKLLVVIASPVDAETGDAYTMQLSDSITCSFAKIAECGESAYSILNFTVVG